jgi:hypothetical protein
MIKKHLQKLKVYIKLRKYKKISNKNNPNKANKKHRNPLLLSFRRQNNCQLKKNLEIESLHG